jgi:hypothetical protein
MTPMMNDDDTLLTNTMAIKWLSNGQNGTNGRQPFVTSVTTDNSDNGGRLVTMAILWLSKSEN